MGKLQAEWQPGPMAEFSMAGFYEAQRKELESGSGKQARDDGVRRVSSQQLAALYRLSAPQIRKDLTQFGEFGIRGVGYEVDKLCDRLATLLVDAFDHLLINILRDARWQ